MGKMVSSIQDLAFSDQIIYRFWKLQDTIGAKLFKSLLFYQGENVDEWFELRDLRNKIAHDYENSDYLAIKILNSIFQSKKDLEKILDNVMLLLSN